MVDTSRGYADLKALFPNNTNRAIHAQSVRDLIESIAHPVVGSGFGLNQELGNGAIQHETGVATAGAWPKTIPNQAPENDVKLALQPNGNNPFPDVTGVMQTGSYVSDYYAQTFGAYEWARVPAGLWLFHWSAFWDSSSVGFRFIQAETMDDRINIHSPIVSDFWGYPGQWGTLFMGDHYHTAASSPIGAHNTQIVGVPASLVMLDDAHSNPGDGLAVSFWTHQSSGGPLNLNYVRLLAIKLAELD